jgi:hypothetical protein
MLNDPLAGKGWPGMAQGRMRCAALGAALTAVTRERTQGRPRAAAACTGPSEQGQDLTGMSQRGSGGQGRPPSADAAMTAFLASSRFTAEPTPREIPARYTPRAGGRGCSCVLSGPELSNRPLIYTSERNASCVLSGSELSGWPPTSRRLTERETPPGIPQRAGRRECAMRTTWV